MLNAVRNLEKKLEKMEKERTSDKAVIFKLLCDIKNLKKTKTDKTIPEKRKRIWKKKISNPRKIKENVAMNGNDRIGDVSQSRMRWRIKQTTTVQRKVNAYTHF